MKCVKTFDWLCIKYSEKAVITLLIRFFFLKGEGREIETRKPLLKRARALKKPQQKTCSAYDRLRSGLIEKRFTI